MKRKPFTLKSGNTVPFKQMGSSPVQQQADASLVAAARHAAMQNVPKDLSAQYNKTAEGVIAAEKGKTEMLTTLAKEAPGILTAAGRGISKGVGKIKSRYKARGEVKKIFKESGVDYKDMSKKERKEVGLTRKDIRKAADIDFEKAYQEKHKDRKSIADIRAITGADQVGKEDRDYEKEYKQLKYKEKLEKRKGKGNGNGNGNGNGTVKEEINPSEYKLKLPRSKYDISRGINPWKDKGFGTDINKYEL